MSSRDRTVDFIWASLAVLFFILSGLHAYLAATAILEIKLPGDETLAANGIVAPSAAVMDVLNREISSVVNTFITAYNKSSRLSNVFGACGYLVAGLTSIFCLVLNRKSP